MNTKAIGASIKPPKSYGAFNLAYVTVFGVYVPESFQPGLLVYLTDLGYSVKARGHSIQVALSDTKDNVSEVRELIKDYAEGSWRA